MTNSVWRVGLGAAGLLLILMFPVYAQKDAGDGEFSFERLADMEKRVDKTATVSNGVPVVENATNPVSETKAAPAAENTSFSSSRSFNMWRSLGALLIVLGGLIVVNKWLHGRFSARRGFGGVSADRRMNVQERLTVDHRRQLLLVTVGNRELVIALGPNEIRPVAEWVRDVPALPREEVIE